jgi:hypothetical protein
MSMEYMFMSDTNIDHLYGKTDIPRAKLKELMINWALGQSLDDYESLTMNQAETLEFINSRFLKTLVPERKNNITYRGDDLKLPKLNIPDLPIEDSVEAIRQYDAQREENTYRSNGNFRNGNKISAVELGRFKRHYDVDEHGAGLSSKRELTAPKPRGYDMSGILGKNYYESSDSFMYKYE